MVRIVGTPTCCVLIACALTVGLGASDPRTRRDPDRPGPLFPLEIAWTTPLASPPASGPVLDQARAYVSLADGGLVAVDRETGAIAWTVAAGSQVSPAIADERVITAGSNGITAWEASTGVPGWSRQLGAAPVWIAAGDGVVVVGCGRAVQAFNASDGAPRWTTELGGAVGEGPALLVGALAVVDDSGAVSLVNVADGVIRWRRQLPGRPGSPVLSTERVFLGTSGRVFWALSTKTGATLWQWRTGGDVSGAAVDRDRVYVATLDNLIRAFDASSGNQRWKAVFTTRPAGAPQIAQGLAVVSGVSPRIEGFARKNGASSGAAVPAAELAGPPALARPLTPFSVAVVAATRDGALTGYRPVRLMFKEPSALTLTALPGRPLRREPQTARPGPAPARP